MSMLGFVDWTDVEVREEGTGSGGSGANSMFLKFGPGKYKVRCLGQPYFFLQTFIPKKLTGEDKDIAVISPGPNEDPLIKLNINPQQKGAINILHRNDDNKLKIMRFGASIYKHIRNYAIETKIDPADLKTGIDFLITVTDPGNNPRNRQYLVTALNSTPITKEEAKKIKADGGLHDLEKYFQPTPIDKINEYIEQYNLVESASKVDGDNTSLDDDGGSVSDAEDLDDSDGDESYAF